MIPSLYGSAAPTSEKSVRSRYETTSAPPSYTCARSSARARSFSLANCTFSYTPWKTRCTSAPASTSSAASRSALGVVFVYWKRPVSVTSAMYSASAISGVSSTPSSWKTSRSTSPVDEAPGTIRFTSPKRVLSWWWSTSTTSAARPRIDGSAIRVSFAQSTASRTRVSASSGQSRRSPSSAMNAYSPGRGASPWSVITASLPSCLSPSFAARSDPSASPSGFSCVVTRKRSCERRASTTAARSFVSGELIDELCHADPALDRRIVLEGQLGGSLQPQLSRDPCLEDAVRGRESLQAPLALLDRAQDAHEDLRMAEIRRGSDAGDRDEADPRVLELADPLGEDLLHGLVDPAHALTHRASRARACAARAPIPGRSGSALPRRGAARPHAPRAPRTRP